MARQTPDLHAAQNGELHVQTQTAETTESTEQTTRVLKQTAPPLFLEAASLGPYQQATTEPSTSPDPTTCLQEQWYMGSALVPHLLCSQMKLHPLLPLTPHHLLLRGRCAGDLFCAPVISAAVL